MNYQKLSKMQAELDLYISTEKKINHADYTLEKIIALSVEVGELLNELPGIFKYWSYKPNNKDKALEEFVDGLHFALSIANDYGLENYTYTQPAECDMRHLILGIQNMISRLPLTNNVKELLDHYLLLGSKINFTDLEIETAYEKKWKTNFRRQQNAY